jgi:hypothetical protein
MDDMQKMEKIIEFIEKMDIEKNLKNSIVGFVKTYDGNNSTELIEFIQYFVLDQMSTKRSRIKAQGYDIMKLSYDDFMNSMKQIKEDFSSLEKGEFPDRTEVADVTEDGIDDTESETE